MSELPFIHLRIHSAYSLAEGAIRVKDLVGACVKEGMPAVAITDTSNMFGALEMSLAARDKGLQAIAGSLVRIRQKAPDNPTGKMTAALTPDKVLLLCQNETGYMNLMALLSEAFIKTESGEDPQVTIESLESHHEGLILLTGGIEGPIGRLVLAGQMQEAEDYLLRLKMAFGDRLYMEIMRHGIVDQDRSESHFLDLAYKHDVQLVATNDCHFPHRGMYEAHDALICIAEGAYVTQSDRKRLTEEHYFKSSEEMKALFADLPEAIRNTGVIAKRCSYLVDRRDPLLPDYTKLDGRSSAEALRDLATDGLKMRLEKYVYAPNLTDVEREGIAKPYWERLEFELGIIEQMGFPGYFLIVADFIQWAKDRDIPVGPGRGSGAGSLVAYALTVTDLDPLRFSLLFERFLNPERVSMPDFDIDFCQDRRDEVIRYVQKEYGYDRVAQIITFGKLQARAVLRDVGRVLQMPYGQVDRICKLVPSNPANPVTLGEALETEPLLKEEQAKDPAVDRLIEIAQQLEGLYRHASTHAAGVVIGDRPLDQLVALYRDPRSDMPVTQFNMKFVEQAGLVKFDFLGLKTLTVIQTAVDLINNRPERQGDQRLDITEVPLDDKGSYEMLCRGEASGVFQLESSGMRDVLRKLKPDRLEDLIAVVALYRPGPMENIPTYIKRKHGEEVAVYMHPVLEPVLKETFGIPIYQEQVMQMAQVLAGYTLGGADLLRRAMGKKIQAEMDKQRQIFIAGSKEHHNVDADLANAIFDQINAFAGYGFNKSHAAAYALVSYHTAWLKANYPVEFLAASMTLDLQNTEKLALFKREIERMKLPILPPDVNKSDVVFSVEYNDEGVLCVRYALAALKNVGTGPMEAVVEERKKNGPFKDIYDFFERVDPRALNKRMVENLVKAGAFDQFVPNRRQVMESLEVLLGHGSSTQAEKNSDQVSLFGDGFVDDIKPSLMHVPDFNAQLRLQKENEAVGFYLSAHPLDTYTEKLKQLGVATWKAVEAGRVRTQKGAIKMAGLVSSKRIMTTQRGSKMAFVALSDSSGSYEVTLFQEVLNNARDLLDSGQPILMSVDVQKRGDEDADLRLTAQSVSNLEDSLASAVKGMKILIQDEKPLQDLYNVMRDHGKAGRGRVVFSVMHRDWETLDIELEQKFAIDASFRQAMKSISGVMDVLDA